MAELTHARDLMKKYNSGIDGVTMDQRATMAEAIKMLKDMLDYKFSPQYAVTVGTRHEYEFTQPMIDHLATLGYELFGDNAGKGLVWFIKISDDIVNEMESVVEKPRSKRRRT